MTTPPPNPEIQTIEPSKSKTWVAVVGGALTVIVPLILSVATYLPDPWPAVIGAVVAVLTAVGVYPAPYKPEGTSVVSNVELKQVATPLPPGDDPLPPPPAAGAFPHPWK
jgi:hypothetical protein